jgi:long-chain acyl-CoA synthetase
MSSAGPPYSSIVGNSSTGNKRGHNHIIDNNECRGSIRRSPKSQLIGNVGLHGCLTLYETFRRSVSLHPNRPCLGERLFDSNGNAGSFVFKSYSQCDAIIHHIASGILHENILGLNDQNLQVLGIYMKNCSSWILSEYACYSINAATVPLYDTLGEETVSYVINHTQMSACLCSSLELPRLCQVANECKSLKVIIINSLVITKDELKLCNDCNLKIVTIDELIRIGTAYPSTSILPNDDSLATFCYTSGTTGNPKGALITHKNIVSVAAAALNSCFDIHYEDYYLSFLPLPHIFERMVVSALLASGSAIGFYQGNPLKLIEDCIALRPSIFCAVPRVLNKIHDKILAGGTINSIKGRMFKYALNKKLENLNKTGQLNDKLWDTIIFDKIKSSLGLDRVRRLVSGGAPLSIETMNFLRVLFGSKTTVHEGYGLTESTGGISLTSPEDLSLAGHVGGPLPVVEVCLADVPDMEYYSTDSIHGDLRCDGRGEILVRGPGIFKGYYKNDKATKEAITNDGWLRTGDIGLWRPDGQLALIDRKKNLLKLSQGEYVAVEKIENILGRSSFVNQIFVHGVSTEDFIVCVVIPDNDMKTKWLSLNKDHHNFDKVVLNDLLSLSKVHGLKGFEMVRNLFIDDDIGEWGPHNGFTTPTQKIKRKSLQDKYQEQLTNMYKDIRKKNSTYLLSKI